MLQITWLNSVEVKKNGTITWYNELPADEKQRISDLAIRKRKYLLKHYKDDEVKINQKRKEKMANEKYHRERLMKNSTEKG